MRIPVAVYTFTVKNGVMARAPQVRLSGFGQSDSEAEQSLMEVFKAWCSSLARCGRLESALHEAGIPVKYDGRPLEAEFYRELPQARIKEPT